MINVTSDINHYLTEKDSIKLADGSVESIVAGLKQICEMLEKDRDKMKMAVKRVGFEYFDYRAYKERMRVFLEKMK